MLPAAVKGRAQVKAAGKIIGFFITMIYYYLDIANLSNR